MVSEPPAAVGRQVSEQERNEKVKVGRWTNSLNKTRVDGEHLVSIRSRKKEEEDELHSPPVTASYQQSAV
jgi:hypothetical protein